MPDRHSPLEHRIQRLEADPTLASHPLMAEVRFFAQRAIKLDRTLEKLTRISDTMQAQIMEQRLELKRLNQQKDRFFAIIAHDLRGPLHSFVEVAKLLRSGSSSLSEAQRAELIDILVDSGTLASELTENLLDWAQLRMDALQAQPGPVELGFLFRQAQATFGAKAAAKDHELAFADTHAVVQADLNMLTSVLGNLITNAIKFTPRGGRIAVSARTLDDRIELWVQDTGPGVRPDLIEHLFDVDIKTTTHGTEKERGTGLGLPLCKEMLQRLGGEIRIDNAPGGGAAFLVTLPAASSVGGAPAADG